VAIEFRLVEGPAFAAEASRLLSAAWPLPSLHYSPEYVGWQLAFPGPCPAPAIAAFSGSTAVGFAASTHRRLRVGFAYRDILIVSFVAVDPAYRNQGIAGGLYQNLLAAIQSAGLSVVTFARANSAGQRAIERAYPAAGFSLQSFGLYTPYGTMAGASDFTADWTVAEEMPLSTTTGSVARNAPTPEQCAHYRQDPRQRRLLVHRTGTAWAWATRLEYVSAKGIEAVTTLESLWIDDPLMLPGLAAAAAQLWHSPTTMVHTPNLLGLDPVALRSLGFRQAASPWIGYCADMDLPATGTNLEIV